MYPDLFLMIWKNPHRRFFWLDVDIDGIRFAKVKSAGCGTFRRSFNKVNAAYDLKRVFIVLEFLLHFLFCFLYSGETRTFLSPRVL